MSKIYVDEIAGIASPSTVAIPGHVIQVVQVEETARNSIASSSYTATSLTGSITPTSTSSKILITISSGCNTQGSAGRANLTIYRGSTDLTTQTDGMIYVKGDSSRIQIPIAFSFLDSPNTTSSTTYTLYARNAGPTGNIEVPPSSSQLTTITLMEIAG